MMRPDAKVEVVMKQAPAQWEWQELSERFMEICAPVRSDRCLVIWDGRSARQFQIIQHAIHRQFSEHDQLRDTQQRSALRRGYEVGEVLGDGSG